jgi:hypothetical protein
MRGQHIPIPILRALLNLLSGLQTAPHNADFHQSRILIFARQMGTADLQV